MTVERIEQISGEAAEAIASASDADTLEQLRVRYLGRKSDLTAILRGIGELEPADRGPVGKLGNATRERLEGLLEERLERLAGLGDHHADPVRALRDLHDDRGAADQLEGVRELGRCAHADGGGHVDVALGEQLHRPQLVA